MIESAMFAATGQIGEVMQESTKAALSWLRANGGRYALDLALEPLGT